MYRAIQHIPNFVDGTEPKIAEFDSVEDLLEVDWVKSYLEWEEADMFVQTRERDCLMVANKDHTWWWVVAHVPRNSLTNLEICEYNT